MIGTESDDFFNPVRCFLRRSLRGAAEDFRRQRNATFVARVAEYLHDIGVQFIRRKFSCIHRNSKSFVFYPNRVIGLIAKERKSNHRYLKNRRQLLALSFSFSAVSAAPYYFKRKQ